jgi:uncharacterized protein YcsI (UPF0317 family)
MTLMPFAASVRLETSTRGEALTTAARISGPKDLWGACRTGEWDGPTPGVCGAFVQTNLFVLPHADAFDFLRFCGRNPKPCPPDRGYRPGRPRAEALRRRRRPPHGPPPLPRLPQARDGGRANRRAGAVAGRFRGVLDRVQLLVRRGAFGGVPVRHVEAGTNVPMYRTSAPCTPAGASSGPLVVSMRPIPARLVPLAVTTTARVSQVHGAPVHVGDPGAIGVADLDRPDYGEPVKIRPGEFPVFWACGMMPQAVALEAAPEVMITHSPGHMFVTRTTNEGLLAAHWVTGVSAGIPDPGERRRGGVNVIFAAALTFVTVLTMRETAGAPQDDQNRRCHLAATRASAAPSPTSSRSRRGPCSSRGSPRPRATSPKA